MSLRGILCEKTVSIKSIFLRLLEQRPERALHAFDLTSSFLNERNFTNLSIPWLFIISFCVSTKKMTIQRMRDNDIYCSCEGTWKKKNQILQFSCATRQRISKTMEINATSSADLRIFIKSGIAPASLTAFWCCTVCH